MYSTCLFCHGDLGKNESLEAFPVGRRLAFDAAQGRLWVICRKCERWNLTPLEERWEVVEECERLFTQTRLRVSSDNIGLSRLREGLELVRIGKPQRPEMAAWRYGDQFGRRRRNYVTGVAALGLVGVGVLVATPLSGVFAALGGGTYITFQLASFLHGFARDKRVRARVSIPGRPRPAIIRGTDMKRLVLASDGENWTIKIPFTQLRYPPVKRVATDVELTRDLIELKGAEALRAAATILPALNASGANRQQVNDAVRVLEDTPNTDRLFASAPHDGMWQPGPHHHHGRRSSALRSLGGSEVFLDRLPRTLTLALEMAAHEDIERRAMLGELVLLEQAWRDAEQIAAIADAMFIPATVDQEFDALKQSE